MYLFGMGRLKLCQPFGAQAGGQRSHCHSARSRCNRNHALPSCCVQLRNKWRTALVGVRCFLAGEPCCERRLSLPGAVPCALHLLGSRLAPLVSPPACWLAATGSCMRRRSTFNSDSVVRMLNTTRACSKVHLRGC